MTDKKREGPAITIKASCTGCRHELLNRFLDAFCTAHTKQREIHFGETPGWCPFLAEAIKRSVER